MAEKQSKWRIFTAGIIRENPVLRLVLGCCSALAVTTTVSGALGMGLAMTFVLVCSNIVISALRKVIPAKVHLPCYIVIQLQECKRSDQHQLCRNAQCLCFCIFCKRLFAGKANFCGVLNFRHHIVVVGVEPLFHCECFYVTDALPAAMELAEKYHVEMPIAQTVNAIVKEGMSASDALRTLMDRNRKNEMPQGYENI